MANLASIPFELVAVPALVVAGSLVGRSCGIRPEGARNGWTVVPNLWGGIVAPPGMLKSHAVGEAASPLSPLAAEAREAYERDKVVAEAGKFDAERKLAVLKRSTKAPKTGDETVQELMQEIRDSKRVAQRRYSTSDATPEKLAELLADNPRGILLLRDELAGWLATFERQGRENERSFYLEAWEGLNPYDVDRIARGSIHISALCVSVLGGIQPGKLASYVADALAGGGGADGLLQRFQLIVWPDGLPPYRRTEREPDRVARERAFKLYRNLDGLKPERVGATLEGTGRVPCLTFDCEAQALFDTWRDELETRLRGDELQRTPAFCSHLAKYRSLMPSLALLFYLLDRVSGASVSSVSQVPLHSARLAATWCDYLEAHARKLYRLELEANQEAARALAAKLEAGEVADGCAVRELYRRGWSGLATPEAVWQALTTLERLGWVRVAEVATGGRPSHVVKLHHGLREAAL